MAIGLSLREKEAFSRRLHQAFDALKIPPHKRNAWLQDVTGITQQSVAPWLVGKSMPAEPRRDRLAIKLGVRRAWLFEGSGDMYERASMGPEGNVVPFNGGIGASDPGMRETALMWQLVVNRINTFIANGVLHAAQIEALDKVARSLADMMPLPPKRDD